MVPTNYVPLAMYYIIALLSVKYPSGVSRIGILPTGFLAKNAGDLIGNINTSNYFGKTNSL